LGCFLLAGWTGWGGWAGDEFFFNFTSLIRVSMVCRDDVFVAHSMHMTRLSISPDFGRNFMVQRGIDKLLNSPFFLSIILEMVFFHNSAHCKQTCNIREEEGGREDPPIL